MQEPEGISLHPTHGHTLELRRHPEEQGREEQVSAVNSLHIQPGSRSTSLPRLKKTHMMGRTLVTSLKTKKKHPLELHGFTSHPRPLSPRSTRASLREQLPAAAHTSSRLRNTRRAIFLQPSTYSKRAGPPIHICLLPRVFLADSVLRG